jgi:DNA-binding NarL/FixJ family response regulator
MRSKIKIIIVDDSPTFLEGISTFISQETDYEIAACFLSGTALLENLDNYDPDLILLDIEMPGLNGIETARRLSYYGVELKLVAITLHHDKVYIKQLRESGFRGFVNKNKVSEDLCQVFDHVLKDELAFPEMH